MTTEERLAELEVQIAELQGRVRMLEYRLERRDDEEGYAEQGARYQGNHPARCACDRCLRRKF